MKKSLFVLCAALTVLCLLLAAGCGGGTKTEESTTEGEEVEVINLDEDVNTGIVGTYKDVNGGAGTITLTKDGKFQGNAWGSEKSGTYKVETTPEDTHKVILTFEDGTSEDWGVGISMGKVVAVTSPDGVQYNKEGVTE